jgi:hypothetical protein
MNEEDIQKQIDKTASDSQYGVYPVSYHTHNGTDSPVVEGLPTATTIAKSGSTALQGNVTLTGSGNTTLTQSGQNIDIGSTGLSTSFDYQVFTTPGSGTWTKPAGATANSMMYIQMWGGGGGGHGATGATSENSPQGGGGGEYIELFVPASFYGSTVGLIIGDGGAGGVGNSNGSAGENSSFGGATYLHARGGGPGVISPNQNGKGGGYFPATFNVTPYTGDALDQNSGGTSQGGYTYSGSSVRGGGGGGYGNSGGISIYGGNGGDTPSGNGNGGDGYARGGGGAGAKYLAGGGSYNGGKGGRGEIRVWTFL